jgi:hypothetical protein
MLFAAACAPQDVAQTGASARFSAFPETLFQRAESACNQPNETFLRYSREKIECRLLLPPATTAAVILTYDGTLEDLPQAVIRFEARAEASGYIVEIMPYLRVPRRGAAPLHVLSRDQVLVRQMRTLMVQAGGVPE